MINLTNKIPHENHCMTPRLVFLILILLSSVHPVMNAQVDTSYAFIVAGHAYGAHAGGNLGLHPALLNSLNSGYDPNVSFIVFTGDIVNNSTSEAWLQVDDELSNYPFSYYYAMGNHDANTIGYQVFEDKFGGAYYSFCRQSGLFIVLNSTEGDRCISPTQMDFLEDQLDQAGDNIKNIFIFFHEIIWNSHIKYIDVLSNSRSRYPEMINHSNYWTEVHPLLLAKPDKNFYVIAGDVGGNTDAIAAFYDTWDNVTLLASGMGEVADENYLLINVYTQDSIAFELVPLNGSLTLPDIAYYSVPPAAEAISGPAIVSRGDIAIEYSVPAVFNATSYVWQLPDGATGTSTSNNISVDFGFNFTEDTLSVQAARAGFGKGPAASLLISADNVPVQPMEENGDPLKISFDENNDCLTISIKDINGDKVTVRLFDNTGRIIRSERIVTTDDFVEMQIDKHDISTGIFFLSVSTETRHITKEFLIR